MREIHHRVKNNLAVIISLLSLQASRVKDDHIEQVLQESRNRIRSMALIHEALYHSENIASVSMKSYTENLSTKLLQAIKGGTPQIRLLYEIEDIVLDIDQAIPCGLILNELITNSIKHAFPEGKGSIKVAIRNIDSGEMELVVHDNGIGMREGFDLSNSESLGLMIVATLVEQQLEGSLNIRNEEGACFSIHWPSMVKGEGGIKDD